MKKLMSIAAIAIFVAGASALADCGSCKAPEKKCEKKTSSATCPLKSDKKCAEGCEKKCCEKKAEKKCGQDCKKPCCAPKAAKKGSCPGH